jgi:hypothetical protein
MGHVWKPTGKIQAIERFSTSIFFASNIDLSTGLAREISQRTRAFGT